MGHKHSSDNIYAEKHKIKLIVVGDPLDSNDVVPKSVTLDKDQDEGRITTTFLITLASGTYPADYVPTVFDNNTLMTKYKDKTLEIGLWDTAGQDEYDRLRPLSYADANIILITFSLISPVSFENARAKWFGEVTHYCPGVPIIFCGFHKQYKNNPTIINALAVTGITPVNVEEVKKLAETLHTQFFEVAIRTKDGFDEISAAAIAAGFESKPQSRCYKDNTAEAKRRIQAAIDLKMTKLTLSYLTLKEIPSEILALADTLVSLSITNNELNDLSILTKMIALKELAVYDNPLSVIDSELRAVLNSQTTDPPLACSALRSSFSLNLF